MHSFESYGTVVLIAGGIGITYPISHMRELIHGFASRTVAMRRLTLIWVVRHLGTSRLLALCPKSYPTSLD